MTKKSIWIEDLAEAFEDMDASWKGYVNTEKGEIVFVPLSEDERQTFTKEELDAFDEIPFLEEYVSLPEQKDLREYDIMEQYTDDLLNTGYKQRLYHALHNGKPFRNFRSQIRYLGLEEDYNHYRYIVYTALARKFCIEKGIPYEVDSDEVKEYLEQIEEDEKFDQEMDALESTLDEFEYEEEFEDYFE
ncbi:MAG: hypothetical protein KBT48_00385 [Firmicutes bacterium]|nr:hypothetical protein [Bacillota bacterium]